MTPSTASAAASSLRQSAASPDTTSFPQAASLSCDGAPSASLGGVLTPSASRHGVASPAPKDASFGYDGPVYVWSPGEQVPGLRGRVWAGGGRTPPAGGREERGGGTPRGSRANRGGGGGGNNGRAKRGGGVTGGDGAPNSGAGRGVGVDVDGVRGGGGERNSSSNSESEADANTRDLMNGGCENVSRCSNTSSRATRLASNVTHAHCVNQSKSCIRTDNPAV